MSKKKLLYASLVEQLDEGRQRAHTRRGAHRQRGGQHLCLREMTPTSDDTIYREGNPPLYNSCKPCSQPKVSVTMNKYFHIICIVTFLQWSIASVSDSYASSNQWKCENVELSGHSVVNSSDIGEIAYVPPYHLGTETRKLYNAASHDYSTATRTVAYIVTSLIGYFNINDHSGWMVKAKGTNTSFDGDTVKFERTYDDLHANDAFLHWGAFQGRTQLRKIVLPPTIKEIGVLAFGNCNLEELVCMASVPPILSNDAFKNATIAKVIVPKGSLASYKNATGWSYMNIVEGNEANSVNPIVEHEGGLYEIIDGKATFIGIADGELKNHTMPLTVSFLSNGERKTAPVTSVLDGSLCTSTVVTINDNITEITDNHSVFRVSETHPTLKMLTDNVISNKSGTIAYHVFGGTVPHGVTTIANEAFIAAGEDVYLPTTLTYIGKQSIRPTLYMTSEIPPTMVTGIGRYVPEAYKENYNARYNFHNIPAGCELVSDNGVRAYFNPKKGTFEIYSYAVGEGELSSDGALTSLPITYYFCETMNGPVEKYNVGNIHGNGLKKIHIPEGIKEIMFENTGANSNVQEIYLPSTLEKICCLNYENLSVIQISPANKKFDSRNNCNAIIETKTNTLLAGCKETVIPNDIEHIADSAFYNIKNMRDIVIPSTVKSIGKCAFHYCEGNNYSTFSVQFAANSQLTSIQDSVFCGAEAKINNLPERVETIGNYAFQRCKFKNLILPATLETIGKGAFSESTGFTSINIPDKVCSIPEYAFRGCYELENISIPSSVTTIGESAFYGCTGLTSVTIPNSMTSIGESAFYGCTGLTSVTIPNSVTSINWRAFKNCTSLTSVTIPNSVTSIGSSAFYGCTGLTSVTIPNSVTSIGSYSFQGCTGLTSVIIPNSVTSIDWWAFKNCTSLTSVTIPNSVTSIGSYSFQGCTGLTSVTIGNSVTSIGESAFSGCSGLTVTWNAKYYTSSSPFYDIRTQITEFIIGDDMTSVPACMCYGMSNLKSVTIPNSVTSIGSSAFEGCTGLTSVTIPNSVTSIDSKAFYDCSGLTSVTIGNSVTSIGGSAFEGCSGLTSVTIGNSVTSIGSSAFYGCTGLSSVTIPNSVTSINWWAFKNCTSLTSVTIPNSVTSIGESAFEGTAWYDNQKDGVVYAGKVAYKYKGTMPNNTSIVLKEGTKGISSFAFEGCSGLTSVTIPNSVTSIGNYAFSGCSGLTSVTIPSSVTNINNSVFSGCSGLTSVTIPNSVTSIGESAFKNCTSLTSVTIPNSVTSINCRAFEGCSGLTSVTIPESVTNIEGYAFMESGLASIEIPQNVTYIGRYVFMGCSNLKTVISRVVKPSALGTGVFYNVNMEECTLRIPRVSMDAYKKAEQWKDFQFIEPLPSDKGDINGDSGVTMSDANMAINYFLATDKPEEFDVEAADVNGDEQITMADANQIVNMYLQGNK